MEIRRKDEMLIEQNRLASMGEMLNNIAHQWRQPLNNVSLIIQNVQLTHEGGELTKESLAKEVDVAMEIIQYMSRTIDDFRNFFRQDKNKKTFSLKTAVTGAIEFMAPSLTQSGIGVELQVETDDIEAYGYANEYSQVLLNIINNTKDMVKEREPDAPKISIRIFREAGSSVVTLRDNCGGIEVSALLHNTEEKSRHGNRSVHVQDDYRTEHGGQPDSVQRQWGSGIPDKAFCRSGVKWGQRSSIF